VQKKTFTDTALSLAIAGLLVTFIVSMVWIVRLPSWQQASVILAFNAVAWGLDALKRARRERRLDEVELAALRFGSQWGLYGGIAVIQLMLFVPPFQSFLVGLDTWFEENVSGALPTPAVMFMLGTLATFAAQETARVLITAGWKWSKQ